MSNLSLWRVTTGLNLDNSFIELPVSHYWKPTTLSVSLLEAVKIVDGVSEGEYNGELEINMTSLTQNNTYSVALEWYQFSIFCRRDWFRNTQCNCPQTYS